MDLDPDDVFGDDEDDLDNENYIERVATKELVVYLVDASPKMFNTTCPADDQKDETHFHIAVSCISQSLKTQIINRSYDEIAICFFNTREKKNLQDLNGVFVFNVADRENLDGPTARLIKEFDHIKFLFLFFKDIGSQYGIVSGSRENSLYNALWVAQALLRKGSTKTADKRILLFTNEDDPFGNIMGVAKMDMTRTTLQRAKDAQDLGISIELLPLSRPDEEFNVSLFYADMIGLGGDDLAQFTPSSVGEKLLNMKDQLTKRMLKKRIVRKITFSIAGGLSIELNTYALIRPNVPGTITWLDSVTNRPLKTERFFICADTGALMPEAEKRFQPYKHENIKFTVNELSEIKRISTGHLRLLGFKSLSCLKEYHNLRPSTFVFPSDQEMIGSTSIFIALHTSMLRLKRYAVAFYGSSTHPQLVALVAQEEIVTAGGQVEPPGMHMIYLPYSNDEMEILQLHSDENVAAPRATDDQIKKAVALMNHIDLKDFSVCQFANPALQRHYAVLQALALEEDEMPEIKDETLPDEEGMARPGTAKAIDEFKFSVYGEDYDEENDFAGNCKVSEASRKRKAVAENAAKESANYDWSDLADNGKLKDLTVAELKYYLAAHNIPLSGKKETLISRILTHMGK
ncbi:LOW QUALITY PROTEIN: SAP domain-containing protein/Ku domain-containing protein/Ku_C domain-containing protein/Ku_N domain-containing protein [Cephalotus follicularis]|uniref:ATP-dependent DNA helicase 2 subunit KU70 n=1 Tax=Cephalotus follicularis TaxID=3775 RepID=A0A1Q3AY54_CEPFO|nr:LOW QUALITY PROTEIN: SAP domain-containing protein/Ku domain-containing protein/Ku_C domain-containing protein/Ku_N domain-containing protein [Cephalotus follicularis]